MTPNQVDLVQETFPGHARKAVGELFYDRLFQLDPSLKSLFKAGQERHMMTTIELMVANLRNPNRIITKVETMGSKHYYYGVKDHHYETVGNAFLWALEKSLGKIFTPDVKASWTSFYKFLSSTMMNAAKEAPIKNEFIQMLTQAYQKADRKVA